jgi:hypothetical protein
MWVAWRRLGHVGLAACAFVLAAACTSDKARPRGPDGGSSGTGGTDAGTSGGAAGTTTTGGSGGLTGSGGGAPDSGGAGGTTEAGTGAGGSSGSPEAGAGCTPSCPAATPVCENGSCVECAQNSARCAGTTAEQCQSGHWVPQAACAGATPACTNGICSSAKLVGGMVTVANGTLSAGAVRLVRHGFEFASKACGTSNGNRICVTGGVRP